MARTFWLGQVLERELEYIRWRRSPRGPKAGAHRTLVGLALSGGGIRSATINLGILQALSKMGILPLVDYISTVSGGGYIGLCLSSLLAHRSPGVPRFSTKWESFPFNPDTEWGAAQLSHLRTHGSFLVTRKGILKRETMRSIGQLLSGTVYHLTMAALALVGIALLYMAFLFVVLPGIHYAMKDYTRPVAQDDVAYTTKIGGATRPDYAPNAFNRGTRPEDRIEFKDAVPTYERTVALAYPGLADRFGAKWEATRDFVWNATKQASHWYLWWAIIAGGAIAVIAFVYLREHKDDDRNKIAARAMAGESLEDAHARHVLRVAGWTSLIAVLVWLTGLAVAIFVLEPKDPTPRQANAVLVLILPVVLLGTLRVATWLVHLLIPRREGEWTIGMRSLWGAYQAMTTYALWVALLVALLPVAVYVVREHHAWAGLSGVSSLILARLLTTHGGTSGRWWRLPRSFRRWLLGIAIAVGMLAIVVAISAALVDLAEHELDEHKTSLLLFGLKLFSAFCAVAAAFVVLGFVGDANRLSPHYFYRDRLAETYLYTDKQSRGNEWLSTMRDQSELRLRELHPEDTTNPGEPADSQPSGSPYHLVSCAINLAGSRDLTRKDRKSGYFLFSKLFCGSRHTGYIRTEEYVGGWTKVARALTISGAAASSGIGASTFFAQAFATVLFNLRLGFWMPNPGKPTAVRKERWLPSHFWPKWLWREVTLRTDERSELINLSDGGHTGDNVGIYPLLQRQCKLIIACDAECDPTIAFGSFTEALRHAYIDLKIDVDIDLTMVRPDTETGKSRSHCAVGLIHYAPDASKRRPVGYLCYLKSSMTGDEPEPVLNYKTNHAAFPHESTADLSFEDDQFESYRSLGYHIAEHTFARWVQTDAFRQWQKATSSSEAV